MRIEQLQAFLAVAETGNFGQAARRCRVTQSTVSRQIQALEAQLGLPLFHRSAQAKLTIAGECLLPRARKICQEWTTVAQELEDLLAGKQPELCIAAIHSTCSYFLPPILQEFCQRFPQVRLRVTALGSDRALKVLRDGLVDVAIVMNNPLLTAKAEMVVEVLFSEPIEVLMAADHPLAARATLACGDIESYPQILFKDGYGMQRLVRDWFDRHRAQLNLALELNTLDAFRGVARQGHLVALLPRSALLEARQDPTLAVRPIAAPAGDGGTLEREVILATTRDRLQIPPIETFCQLVREFGAGAASSLAPALLLAKLRAG